MFLDSIKHESPELILEIASETDDSGLLIVPDALLLPFVATKKSAPYVILTPQTKIRI